MLGDGIEHRRFYELPDLLAPGDVLVLNETRVIPARIFGERVPGGGSAELLLLHPAQSARYDPAAVRWIALARPGRRVRAGQRVSFGELGDAIVVAEFEKGRREIVLELRVSLPELLDRIGRMPLPPYVRNDSPEAQERYQTVFARVPGSVAAPTASLHFTPELLAELERRGVELVRISLDVGLGTFRPISRERIDEHAMHAEAYAIEPGAAEALERARRSGRRIVAAGTTVVRALEGNLRSNGLVAAGRYETDLFVTPGFDFGIVGGLITNFHLPRSTLLVLVSAFAGRRRVLDAYAQAALLRYRFYSFGDAMLVWRGAAAG